jgi:hypothetical protein
VAVPCRCPDGRICFADHHVRGPLHRLAETSPYLPPARREDYWPPSTEDLAEWQRRFEQANTPSARARHMKREMRRLLTRRTRWRLWWHGRIDAVAICPAGIGRAGRALARALWRVTGLWSR